MIPKENPFGDISPDILVESELLGRLVEDNARMRKAGCELAEAALHVVKEYDGVHRLSIAVAKWCQAVADEGRRGKSKE